MLQGTVKFFNAGKGFGFITKENGSDIFFHISEVKSTQELQDGDKVEFNEGVGNKGPMATDVTIVH